MLIMLLGFCFVFFPSIKLSVAFLIHSEVNELFDTLPQQEVELHFPTLEYELDFHHTSNRIW